MSTIRAVTINEKQGIEDNLFLYEKRLNSPLSRFLETTPIYVTYYHVANMETVADTGYQDAFSLIGAKSPMRYKKINNFPLYGIDALQIQLQTMEQGIDGSLEGDAVILPNTVKPLPNDFFVIPYTNQSTKNAFLFKVVDIQYDVLRSDGYYKIQYALDYNDESKLIQIEEQVINENEYITDLGIIESAEYTKLMNVKAIYDDIKDTYYSIFYSERHNCFLGDMGSGFLLYDPYQTEFINKHALFNERSNLVSIILTEQFTDPKRKLKYEKSVYRLLERQDLKLVNNFNFIFYPGINQLESTFYRWVDKRVMILDHPINDQIKPVTPIFSKKFVDTILMNWPAENAWQQLIKQHIRGEKITLDEIPSNLGEILLTLDDNLELFFFTPMILYIIRQVINNTTSELTNKKTGEDA